MHTNLAFCGLYQAYLTFDQASTHFKTCPDLCEKAQNWFLCKKNQPVMFSQTHYFHYIPFWPLVCPIWPLIWPSHTINHHWAYGGRLRVDFLGTNQTVKMSQAHNQYYIPIWLFLAFIKANLAFDLAPTHFRPSLVGLGVVLRSFEKNRFLECQNVRIKSIW